jgi:hypothetical protein
VQRLRIRAGSTKERIVKLYAEQRPRVIRQVTFDAVTAAWLAAWIWLGFLVHQRVSASGDGARRIGSSGSSLARNLHDAARALSQVPLVGGKVRAPVDRAAKAATSLEHAGDQLAGNLGKLGAAIGFEVALVPVLVGVFGWLVLRIGYARRAGRAVNLREFAGGRDLLALAGLTRLPATTLAACGDSVVMSWRAADRTTVTVLADAYLDSLGLIALRDQPETPSALSTGKQADRQVQEVAAD